MATLLLSILGAEYSICRLAENVHLTEPTDVELWSLTVTATERSLVTATSMAPPAAEREDGWRALQVRGPLSFDLVGILNALTDPLARTGISVFAISTFDTDYLLVRDEDLHQAVRVLRREGHEIDD